MLIAEIKQNVVERPEINIAPQLGSQQAFMETSADIAVYGGAAGAGKSFALLVEALRHIDKPNFNAVIFRRTYPQIKSAGGLWDTSMMIYDPMGGKPKLSTLEWSFPSGARIKFAHMQHETDRTDWDGAQIPFIGFDQLEHFGWEQFFYMLSRNRSMIDVVPYIRATANPHPDHWLRTFMEWWIDKETGLPIRERSGVLRWFVLEGNKPEWADTREDLLASHGEDAMPKSFTFIPGNIFDNQILLRKNPEYLANLKALLPVDRGRLLDGNWNIRESAGMFFQREWFEIVPATPVLSDEVRYWDRAATPPKKDGSEAKASWTAGVRMRKDDRGMFFVTDVCRFQGSPFDVQKTIKNITTQDGPNVRVGIEQDPGQAGKAEAELQVKNLAGYDAKANPVHDPKSVRVRPLSAQVQAGNVKLVYGSWNEDFINELQNFDGTRECLSDQVDAASGAFMKLCNVKRAGVLGGSNG